ncbi:MAG: hypothetical protein OEU90_15760, partial [Gammaproteobacteria bacterium]|nr:hypothetical protein [Gammaproteobacteria bacterium]
MKRAILFTMSGIALIYIHASAMADGYRPDSDLATGFVNEVRTAEIVVFPTIIRDPYISRFSTASRDLVIQFLEKNSLGNARAADMQFYLGKPQRQSQFKTFDDSIRTIGEQLGSSQLAADYVMVMEVLLPPSRKGVTEVFGIHVYVLKQDGQNVFSFLLNSHHESFSKAKLRTGKMTAKGKEKLAIKSTKIAMQALDEQISRAGECVARSSDKVPTKVQSGVVDNFESGLPSGSDGYGVPLGFSTFNGKRSSAIISTTAEHPALPVETPGNTVLKLDLDVRSWAGVLHSFENDTVGRWINYDWSDAQELSFWLYGNDSGTTLVIDVLDNRNRCSTVDDAERYSYEFVDNFSGWKLFAIPFEVMVRKEIGNGAPNDGLGLSAVHGWGFATLQTGGAVTFYIDDVTLRLRPLLENVPEGLSRENDVWSPVNELPMYGEYEKTEWQKQVDEQFFDTVLPDFGGDREAAAEQFARIGWNCYYEGKKSTAIKRFNQAWLLHPDNQNALWGFAVISRERGKMEA